MGKKTKPGRCVHCLRMTDVVEGDHIFPDSWYPDSTPSTVQRWTAPSCPRCNREFGRMENDLLVRLIFCVDPKMEAAAGLKEKAMRSLGFDTEGLPEKEQQCREALRKTFKLELIPHKDLIGRSGRIPGLGPPDSMNSEWSVPIPYAVLAMVAEKIARGCEWRIQGRFVECPPYDFRVLNPDPGPTPYPTDLVQFVRHYDFGPGCRIERLADPSEPDAVSYSILIWNTLRLVVLIDLKEKLEAVDAISPKREGLAPSEIANGMYVSPYLRDYQDHE